jgi:hypothetical protein
MTHLQTTLIVLSILVTCSHPLCGEEKEEGTKKTIEAPSPDGQFAFRYTGESESEKQTYDLIDKKLGKILQSVAESDPDLGPSARFNMHVLWRPDSKGVCAHGPALEAGERGFGLCAKRLHFSRDRTTGVGGGYPGEAPAKQGYRAEFTEREAIAKGWFARGGDRKRVGWQ